MKLNTNSCFLCCLILIIALSLFLSCSCNNSIFEGLTGAPAKYAVYGISSEWYGGNCNDADIMISDNTISKDISYNLSGTDILSNAAIQVSISFEHIIENDLSMDTIHAYYIEKNLAGRNKIHFLELDLTNNPTISFSCGPENMSLGPGKISTSILDKINLIEVPSNVPPTTVPSNANANANANANSNTNNNNVSVDVENKMSPPTISGTGQFIPPGSSYNPQTGLPFGPNIIQQPYATGYGTGYETNSNNQGIFSSLTSGLNNTFGLNSNSETDNILNNIFNNQSNNTNTNSSMNTNTSMNTNSSMNMNPSNIFTTNDGRQGIANSQNTILGIPSSQIPAGHEDLYILKSQVVPPVCPACPPVYIDNKELGKECPPCPSCARCPEPAFDCKKVPNYEMGPQNLYLPRPVLNDFSTFGT